MPRLIISLLSAAAGPLFGDYPLIRYTIKARDPLYRQHQQDVERWYAASETRPPLAVFRYIPRASEDLFAVSAAFNLPYEAVATLNAWDAPGLMRPGQEILVPNTPGLFVLQSPRNTWERSLAETARDAEVQVVRITSISGERRIYNFYPKEKFSPGERTRFLNNLFTSPLHSVRITSNFGYRPNLFASGVHFHPGIDFRASIGVLVMAARDGVVSDTGSLENLGFFIIIDHNGGYQTVYAHLKEIQVNRGQEVTGGEIIALSGNSGISTGPHLHFEIRRDGMPINPRGLLLLGEQ